MDNKKLQMVLQYPEMIEAIADVLEYGIKKGYDAENWLLEDGKRMSRKENSDSMFHHLAMYYSGVLYDESGLDHRSHFATRALMGVVRHKRGIYHPDDKSTANQAAIDPSSWVQACPTGVMNCGSVGCLSCTKLLRKVKISE